MECCEAKKEDKCCKDLKKTEMKGGTFKMERRMMLWGVIGILFLVALYLVFQAGSNVAIEGLGSATSPVAGAASSSGMVGGC